MGLEYDGPIDPDPRLNVALIGPPKTGKTAGAASAPGPILYLNADLPARMRYARLTYGDKIKPVTATGIQTITDVKMALSDGDFKTLVVDPVGELYRICLEDRLGGRVPETMNNHILSQYRVVGDELESFFRAACRSPNVNVVFVAHDHLVQDESTKETERLPWTGTSNPKLGRTLLGMVDVIGFTGVRQTEEGPEYIAQLVPAKGRPGGDGYNCLADPKTGVRKLDLTEWVQAIKTYEEGLTNAKD